MFPPFDPTAGPLNSGGPLDPFDPRSQRGYERRREMTLNDLLLEQRIIFFSYEINIASADLVIKQLLYLQYEDKSKDIHVYINSPGGMVSATLAIYDTMQFLEPPIHTYCMGMAFSGAAVLLAAGTKGKRYCLPNSKVM